MLGYASAVWEGMRQQELEARRRYPNQWVAIGFYEGVLIAASSESACWAAVDGLVNVDLDTVRVIHTRTWLDALREFFR